MTELLTTKTLGSCWLLGDLARDAGGQACAMPSRIANRIRSERLSMPNFFIIRS
jgi:hypothetical protein